MFLNMILLLTVDVANLEDRIGLSELVPGLS